MKLVRPVDIDDSVFVSSNVAEADYAAYNPATTYADGARVIVVAATHRIYESLQNSNTGHTPVGDADDAWWVLVSATNRWKMFDETINTQTSNSDSIAVVLAPGERINTLAVLNASAETVQLTLTDAVDGVVYDETVTMVSDSGVTDWYAYFFEPIVRRTDVVFPDLPPYADLSVGVTLSDSGATVLCGEIVLGLARDLGSAMYGSAVGIRDFSSKSEDDFGNVTILERAFSRRGSFQVWLDSGLTDQLVELLSEFRATAALYLGIDGRQSTYIYGFYKGFDVVIAGPVHSLCNIDLEGLT